jgi:hypothetical protein
VVYVDKQAQYLADKLDLLTDTVLIFGGCIFILLVFVMIGVVKLMSAIERMEERK